MPDEERAIVVIADPHRRWCQRLAQPIFAAIALVAIAELPGCGPYPPNAQSTSDVESLASSTQSLHARGLPDSDIPALARLRELKQLSFGAGYARNDVTTGFKPWEAEISNYGLSRLSELELPKLNILDLGHCERITDAGLTYVAKMNSVKVLLLDSTLVTDVGMVPLVTMHGLTYLDLRGCAGITDRGLAILESKANWGTICLGGCPNVSPVGIAKLRAALPSLEIDLQQE